MLVKSCIYIKLFKNAITCKKKNICFVILSPPHVWISSASDEGIPVSGGGEAHTPPGTDLIYANYQLV